MNILDRLRSLREEVVELAAEVDELKREAVERPATDASYTELRALVTDALEAYDEGAEESFGGAMTLLREAL